MRWLGLRCQALSPLPPGALERLVPAWAPTAIPGVRRGAGGVTLPVPACSAWGMAGGERGGGGHGAGRGMCPEKETCSARAWRRDMGALALPPPRHGDLGTPGGCQPQPSPAAASPQGDTTGYVGAGEPPGCGGFAFPLIGAVNRGGFSARGGWQEAPAVPRRPRRRFNQAVGAAGAGRGCGSPGQVAPWHRVRATPEERGWSRTLPKEPPNTSMSSKPHRKGHGEGPGDATQSATNRFPAWHPSPVGWKVLDPEGGWQAPGLTHPPFAPEPQPQCPPPASSVASSPSWGGFIPRPPPPHPGCLSILLFFYHPKKSHQGKV